VVIFATNTSPGFDFLQFAHITNHADSTCADSFTDSLDVTSGALGSSVKR
jgi:hypothetical protein